MRHPYRLALLASTRVAAPIAAGPIGQAPPCALVSPANCTFPGGILVVLGNQPNGGPWQPDPSGAFTITLRDAANQPVAGCAVSVDFSNCTELKFCSGSIPPPACPLPIFTQTTNAQGVASFLIVGFVAPGTPPNAGTTFPCAKVRLSTGTIIGSLPVACFDLDGSGTLKPADLAAWNQIFSTGLSLLRADYDFSGFVGLNDHQILQGAIFGGASVVVSPGPCCP